MATDEDFGLLMQALVRLLATPIDPDDAELKRHWRLVERLRIRAAELLLSTGSER